LLRWTTAIDAKWKKLHHYRAMGIVKPGDAYVIAVNGCQLSVFPETRGISQMPFGVEAVFPVGPLAYRLNVATHKIEGSFISERYHLVNRNSAKVPTTSFLDAAYSGVSALIGCAASRCYGKPLDLHVVHNPRTDVPLPLGALGGEDDEWFAAPVSGVADEYELQRAVGR
jgi:type I restriction enzyme S subunit